MSLAPHRRAAGVVLAAGLLPLTACGGDSEDGGGSAAGSSEDPLTVYVGRDQELVGPLIEQFTEETGIEVEARYADTPDALALLLEEGDDSPADVFLSQDAGALGVLSAEGLLSDLPSEITDSVLGDFTSDDDTWVGVTGRARVIAYNSETVDASEVPDNVAALTADEYAGRVGLPPGNASFQAFVTGFRSSEGDAAASEWLEQMAANDTQTFESNGDTLDAIEGGTIDFGLINHYYSYELAAELGADNVVTRLQFPRAGDPGALVNVTGAGILSDSDAAEAFVEYLLSEEGQTYFVENTFEYPLVEGIDAPEGLPALTEIDGPIEDLAELDDVEASIAMIDGAGLN